MKGQFQIFGNAVMFWGVKTLIMLVIYFWLIAPNLQGLDTAVSNFINVAYGFLAIFVIFAMKGMSVGGLFSFRK